MDTGFETQASYRFVISKTLKVAWRVLGLEEFEARPPPNCVHRITLNFGGGEHDCVVEGAADGQIVSLHQERRVIEPHTVTVLVHKEGEDQLLTMKLSHWFWLWTRVLVTLDVRLTTASPPDKGSALHFRQRSWQALRMLRAGAKVALKHRR
jgi:hypothetical protein